MAATIRREEALVLAMARGGSIRAAAKASGYSERQAHRKLADPDFRKRVSHTRSAILDRAVGILAAAGAEATRTLRSLLKSDSDQVRLAAARGILELGSKLRESVELAARVEELEGREILGQ